MSELLSVKDLRAGYGESVVLQDLTLEIAKGEIVCLLGANGAGKTTTTRVLSGLLRALDGDVRFLGSRINEMPTHKRVELGICLAPEGRQVFPDLSVMENLLLGGYCRHARGERASTLTRVLDLFPVLATHRNHKAGLLSGGQQQMLAIGRALMGRPHLLILDEPSLGLAPKMILHVYEAILKAAQQGLSILFVEQNAQAALSVAHRGYVLNNGRIALSGSAEELRGSKLVQEAFLARDTRSASPSEHSSGSGRVHAAS
ncbi:hypothetical protein BZM26_00770 [Paraburkholderia strydomiana]|nr:hypothetical protein BZM26_00770 [Paraburkholderia strydomiana]